MAQAREMKNAIQMGHFGNLAAIAALIADGDKTAVPLGYILGKATGVSYRANPNGDEPSMGLKGVFEATPTQDNLPIMVAPVCFLPRAFMDAIVAQMMSGKEKEIPKKAPAKGKHIDVDAGLEIPLALEIGIRKSTGSAVGYEFSVVSLANDKGAQDMFADLRTALPSDIVKRSAPALPSPSSAKANAAPNSGGKKKK